MEIHHIGYLVKKIGNAQQEFEKLGYQLETKVIFDEDRKASICFMVNGYYRIELICPEEKSSPLYGLLKKYKNSPYHIAYISASLDLDIKRLENQGYLLFIQPSTAVALDNKKVAFLTNTDLGMIELIEK